MELLNASDIDSASDTWNFTNFTSEGLNDTNISDTFNGDPFNYEDIIISRVCHFFFLLKFIFFWYKIFHSSYCDTNVSLLSVFCLKNITIIFLLLYLFCFLPIFLSVELEVMNWEEHNLLTLICEPLKVFQIFITFSFDCLLIVFSINLLMCQKSSFSVLYKAAAVFYTTIAILGLLFSKMQFSLKDNCSPYSFDMFLFTKDLPKTVFVVLALVIHYGAMGFLCIVTMMSFLRMSFNTKDFIKFPFTSWCTSLIEMFVILFFGVLYMIYTAPLSLKLKYFYKGKHINPYVVYISELIVMYASLIVLYISVLTLIWEKSQDEINKRRVTREPCIACAEHRYKFSQKNV